MPSVHRTPIARATMSSTASSPLLSSESSFHQRTAPVYVGRDPVVPAGPEDTFDGRGLPLGLRGWMP